MNNYIRITAKAYLAPRAPGALVIGNHAHWIFLFRTGQASSINWARGFAELVISTLKRLRVDFTVCKWADEKRLPDIKTIALPEPNDPDFNEEKEITQ